MGVLAVILVSGCVKDSHPVAPDTSPATSPLPPPPRTVDTHLVGYWYPIGSGGGYAFYDGGGWEALVAFQNRLTLNPYPPYGGEFSTPKPGVCNLWWTEYDGNTRLDKYVTFTYVLSNSDSLLTITNPSVLGPDSLRVYARKGIADLIPW
jgi:hypothetical protein